MATVLQHKVVASLPSPPEPDSIYYVRVGEGFDIHVTNGLGEVVAYSLNAQVAIENLPEWSTAETADEALTALGMSASGKTVATGTPAQGRTALGLADVDNTSDMSKPVSTAQQTALDLKVDKADFTAFVTLSLAQSHATALLF